MIAYSATLQTSLTVVGSKAFWETAKETKQKAMKEIEHQWKKTEPEDLQEDISSHQESRGNMIEWSVSYFNAGWLLSKNSLIDDR